MGGYEYIIASLPVLTKDGKSLGSETWQEVIDEIEDNCSKSDRKLIETLISGWQEANMTPEFYGAMIRSHNAFLRRYFSYDLMARNAKVEYLNKALGRPEGTDVVTVDGYTPDEDELCEVEAVLSGEDLLARERGLDDCYWRMAEEAVRMQVFTIDVILSFIARYHIVMRWLQLDEQSGREMFKRLVDEVRGTFKGVNYTE